MYTNLILTRPDSSISVGHGSAKSVSWVGKVHSGNQAFGVIATFRVEWPNQIHKLVVLTNYKAVVKSFSWNYK